MLESKAQFDTSFAKTNIIRCADSLVQGFKTRDWEKFARYSYPAMIGSMGGKSEFIHYIQQTFLGLPDSAWKLYKVGKVLQLVKTNTDLQAIVELLSVVEWEGRKATTTAYLVAESWNGGQFWTFFDSQNDINLAKTIKPDLSSAITIPEKKEKIEQLPPPARKTKG